MTCRVARSWTDNACIASATDVAGIRLDAVASPDYLSAMRCIAGVILCVQMVMAATFAVGAEPFQLGPVPVEGVLVLRNGQAVAGSLTRAGDHFFVGLPDGEIRLRADDVEMACRDLDEAYLRKRAVMPLGDAHRHLDLAGWCMRHGLLGPAASELAEAMRANPNHPLIPVLRRRLEMGLHPKEEEPAAERQELGPSREELDAMVRRLPSGVVETFTAEVQPLLMNNCTSSGCHGPNSEHELRLLRVPRNRPGGRRITQQNLHAVLQWVDRDTPENSRLLTVTIEPHGGTDRPVFTQRQVGQLQQLAGWVAKLGNLPERDEVPATVDRAAARARTASNPVSPSDPFSATPPSPTPTSGVTEPADQRPRVQRGATPEASVPVDPFDPDIFNRQYSGKD